MFISEGMPKENFIDLNYDQLRYEFIERLVNDGDYSRQMAENSDDGRDDFCEAEYNRKLKERKVERALNFVTNFARGIKIIDKGLNEITTKDGKAKYDARVQCDCYAVLDGKRIERSVFGSRQMFGNPAVSSFAVYEAARSQATKSFAETLGKIIGRHTMNMKRENGESKSEYKELVQVL